jgi:DNA-binding response OmpR family regulator
MNGKKILIVEDDELLLSVLSKRFEDSGYEVVRATDGEDGLKKYFTSKPDMVVLDIAMPKKSGLEMLQDIDLQDHDTTSQFIVLSNSHDLNDVAHALSHKAVAYLVKSDQQIDSIVTLVEEKLKHSDQAASR